MIQKIIFIGFDNTGKSTTVERLADECKIRVVRSSGPGDINKQIKWFEDQMDSKYDSIHDRFNILEEQIYGPILRGTSNFEFNGPEMKRLKESLPLIVYTRPPKEVIFNWGEREQMCGIKEEAHKILAAYDELIFKLVNDGWKLVIYDYTHKPESWHSLIHSMYHHIVMLDDKEEKEKNNG